MPLKLTALPALASPSYDDLMYVVDDPLGVLPVSKGVTVQNLFTGLVNVKQFGAIGNGIADDTVAIQAAINALLAASGGSLYFPSGTYKIASTLLFTLDTGVITKSVNIYGDGATSVIYYTPIDGTDCLHFLGGATNGMATLHIHDLQILGPNNIGSGNGIRLQRCLTPPLIDSVVVNQFSGGAGIYVESSWAVNLVNVWSQLNLYGLLLTNDPVGGGWGSTVNTAIRNSHLQFNGSHGLYIPVIVPGSYTIEHLTVDTCIIQGNGGGGIYAYGLHHFQFRAIYFETNDNVIGDIFLEHSIFGIIQTCGSHYAAPPYQSLTLDADCSRIGLTCNNWQGTVSYDGVLIYDIFSTWTTDVGVWNDHQLNNAPRPLVVNDTSPSVKDDYEPKFWYTANTVPTLINDFDDGFSGQDIVIFVHDAFTTFDFTGSNLKGNNGADYIASSGDVIRAILFAEFGNTYWYCVIIK